MHGIFTNPVHEKTKTNEKMINHFSTMNKMCRRGRNRTFLFRLTYWDLFLRNARILSPTFLQ